MIDRAPAEYSDMMAQLSPLELKEQIEDNNPGMARKDLQRIVMRAKDKAMSEAEERVGVKIGELPNGLMMGNPGNFRLNEKV